MHDAEYKTIQSMKLPAVLSGGNLEDNFSLQQCVIARMGVLPTTAAHQSPGV